MFPDQKQKTIAWLRWGLHLLWLVFVIPASAADCPPAQGVALQVLGSGGPIADDGRASSGYLLWHNGRARALVDAGGGAFLRFAEAGADFADLDAILLSHLHADHSAALPALLKSGVFSSRERSLVLAGPPAGGNARVQFPSLEDFVTGLLQPDGGAYGYLGGYLDGSDGLPYLRLVMIEDLFEEDAQEGDEHEDDAATDAVEDVSAVTLRDSALTITALPVPHGPVPALAYRISVDGKVLVFAGDQDGRSDDLAAFAAGADVLVLHMPIPENAGAAAQALHAVPSRLGEIARDASAQRVVLSHFMRRSLEDLDANLAEFRSYYPGNDAASEEAEVLIADDLLCVPL